VLLVAEKPIIEVQVMVQKCILSDPIKKKIAAAMETFMVEIGDIVQKDLIKSEIKTTDQ
jgi:hypothetical protein